MIRKTIKISDFSIEIEDEIIEENYKYLSDEELVNKVVDDIQSLGLFACFDKYEVETNEE